MRDFWRNNASLDDTRKAYVKRGGIIWLSG